MLKRMLLMLAAVLVFVLVVGFLKVLQVKAAIAKGASFAPPPAAVTSIKVAPQKWQPVLSAVGSMKAINGVVVSTDLAGIVTEIAFESGTQVKKGALLVALDSKQEEAQLQSSEARLSLARADLERKRDLIQKKAIAQSDWDIAQSELRQAEAAVSDARALIARKRITAPFDGSAGIRQVNLGQYMNPGAAIVPLQSLDPIYVEFSLPQQHIAQVKMGKSLRIRANGIDGAEFEGDVTAVDSRVEESTRNFTVQGTVKNPEHKLRPGMFVTVDLLLPEEKDVLAIPSSGINYAPYGDSIFVVKNAPDKDGMPAQEVEEHFVKLGATRGDLVRVEKGIAAGDEVVTSGTFKLQNHAPVKIDNSVQPSADPAPQPEEK